MTPIGWSIVGTKVRRASLQFGEAPAVDRGAVQLKSLIRAVRTPDGGRVDTALAWKTDEDGERIMVFECDLDKEGAKADCFEMETPRGRELWCFGGAADVALAARAA